MHIMGVASVHIKAIAILLHPKPTLQNSQGIEYVGENTGCLDDTMLKATLYLQIVSINKQGVPKLDHYTHQYVTITQPGDK